MELVKQAVTDPSSLEYAVAQRAYGRLKQISADLEVAAEAAASISDMARQVADILIMMRQVGGWLLRWTGGGWLG